MSVTIKTVSLPTDMNTYEFLMNTHSIPIFNWEGA